MTGTHVLHWRSRRALCVAWVVLSALLTACAGGASTTGVSGAGEPCAVLAQPIHAGSIGLPSGGAIVESATLVEPAPLAMNPKPPFTPAPHEFAVKPATPEYCKVFGAIKPVDPCAPPIRFQVNLRPRVDAFMRLHMTPGADHMGMGAPSSVDLLTVLTEWVEKGKAPSELVQVKQQPEPPFAVVMSRPMCRYPAYPRYRGTGDPQVAASFECASPSR